ncbi:OmpW family protein [uncultured Cocleimonas sp.]|uniref:OmpW/AlkL family protein n=1 Tax=uncultured Cocleimonas sp. TaxID=1051587 RepID=UPI0026300290|nr:OmpW family outer membrane protein [uncultured Cocleimonas sp.]
MKKVNAIALAVSAAILALPMAASAYEKGDILLKFGAATVVPDDKSDDIQEIAGEAVSADNETQLGLSGTYMLSEKLGIEVLAATPFTHQIKADGGTLDGASIGEIKHLPPTISAQYYLLGGKGKFQPYVGAGLNYTIFFHEKVGNDAAGLGYTKLKLDNSIGLAAQIGVDYQINDKWFLNASAMYADIDTDATLTGPGATTLHVDYDLDPMVYRLNVGYKF